MIRTFSRLAVACILSLLVAACASTSRHFGDLYYDREGTDIFVGTIIGRPKPNGTRNDPPTVTIRVDRVIVGPIAKGIIESDWDAPTPMFLCGNDPKIFVLRQEPVQAPAAGTRFLWYGRESGGRYHVSGSPATGRNIRKAIREVRRRQAEILEAYRRDAADLRQEQARQQHADFAALYAAADTVIVGEFTGGAWCENCKMEMRIIRTLKGTPVTAKYMRIAVLKQDPRRDAVWMKPDSIVVFARVMADTEVPWLLSDNAMSGLGKRLTLIDSEFSALWWTPELEAKFDAMIARDPGVALAAH